jgi:nucleoside-diphosphate-sugar epimerase
MKVRWITTLLGTAAATEVIDAPTDIYIIDVRDLVDKAGNGNSIIQEKVNQGITLLLAGKKIIVCCDYGISRSNAIATGILAIANKLSFDEALRQVQEATGETEIKLEPLNAVREALGFQNSKVLETKNSAVLVTGSQGFLGSVLCTALNNEFRVVSPTRRQIDIGTGRTQLDLLVSEENISSIVHLANPRIFTSNIAMGQSITMMRNIIDVCLSKNIPLVYLSSSEIYSGYTGIIHANESTPAFPSGPYGETKYLVEILIEHCRQTKGLKCALLRSSLVYGTSQDKPKFLYNFIRKAQQNQKIITHHYNNGNPSLDLLHIDDLVSALVATLKSGFIDTINLGTGTLSSTLKIAEILRNHFDSSSPITQIEIDSSFASISMNWDRAKAELNWQPTISLEKGINRLLADNII